MEVEADRTAVLPLTALSDDTIVALHETAAQYYWCQQETSEYCWPDTPKQPSDVKTNNRSVRDSIYGRLKAETDLNANLVQAAIKQIVENVDSLQTHWEHNRRISQPDPTHDDGWVMNFDKRSATFHKYGIDLSLADGTIHSCRFLMPDTLADTPYNEYVLSNLFEYRMTRIEYRPHSTHEYYAHIVTKAEFETPPLLHQQTDTDTLTQNVAAESPRTTWRTAPGHTTPDLDTHNEHLQRVLGVDLNVTGYSAVTSAGGFHGNADQLTHKRNEFERVRAGLQQTGTESAHRTLTERKHREWEYFDELAHAIANRICVDAVRTQATHVAFEQLTDIRDKISNEKQYQQWFFNRLQKYASYKLEPFGITVDDVTARHTSQACSRTDCSHTAKSNRDGKQFCCEACGYELDADLNAAKNIAYRYVREELWDEAVPEGETWFDPIHSEEELTGVPSGHTSPSERAACQLALKSGTITLDGNFTREAWPTPAGLFTDKPHPQQSEHTASASD